MTSQLSKDYLIDCSLHRRLFLNRMEAGIAIIPTSPIKVRNSDVNYRYRPDSDFYYLTGFHEADAVAVLCAGTEKPYTLFCNPKNPAIELWEGERTGMEKAIAVYGADQAYPIDQIAEILPKLLENHEHLYYHLGRYPSIDQQIIAALNVVRGKARHGIKAPTAIHDYASIMAELRLRKTPMELASIEKAAKVSARAHLQAMAKCRPDMYEYQIEAILTQAFLDGGSHYPAYPSIVASGSNACTLHYTNNNRRLANGDLLLIDAGAEINCYAADITRTFPVNGRFTGEQRCIYEIVLAAQQAAIDQALPGNSWDSMHQVATRVLIQGLSDLGLLSGSVEKQLETGDYKCFYPHRTGHWLGLDVHDTGAYKVDHEWRLLEPGMVFTIEPGLYIRSDSGVNSRWHDIGIRIEDDILITETGNKILTASVGKEIAEIEAVMAG